MYILVALQIISAIFLIKNPDELFTGDDRDPYVVTAENVSIDEKDGARISHLIGNVRITHGKTVITGDEGYAYEKEQMAEIIGNVRIDDEGTIITSENGRYFREKRMAVLTDSVELHDGRQVLKADSLVYLKDEKVAKASGDVVLIDEEQNTEVTGTYGEYDFVNEQGFMTDNPMLTLSEKEREITITGDTLKIRRKENFMSCSGNVEVREDSIVAHSGFLEYYSDSERIYLKEEPIIEQQDKSVLTGVSIEVFMRKKKIVKTVATVNAEGNYRFSDDATNDVKGDTIIIFFKDGKTDRIVVEGNARGVYRKIITEEKKNE